ncbi:hypothetical protein TYRP_006957, partial [Tyrophagus putrescentiae]
NHSAFETKSWDFGCALSLPFSPWAAGGASLLQGKQCPAQGGESRERSERGPRKRALTAAKSRQVEPPAQTSMYGCGAQIKTARSCVTWLTKNARRRGPRERSERGPSRRAFLVSQVTPGKKSMRAQLGKKVAVHSAKRRGLTTLGHCERPPTRVSRTERAGPESVGVHSAQVSSG